MRLPTLDIISYQLARTLSGLFRERVRRTPEAPAYRYYDAEQNAWHSTSWGEMGQWVARWQAGLITENLASGARVGIMLGNCREWVLFDQAALGLGLVTVPLYAVDRADNAAYIIVDAGIQVLLIEGLEHWQRLKSACPQLKNLKRILVLHRFDGMTEEDPRLTDVDQWLPSTGTGLRTVDCAPETLATIVYTSGTTGNPKGVMLSHRNILWNVDSALAHVPVYREDLFLSFLPLSHSFERTIGYYLPMAAGAAVAYARSIPLLAEDLLIIRPTIMISVPRIFERVYNKIMEQLNSRPPLARLLFQWTAQVGWQRFLYQQKRGPWRPAFVLWPLLDRLVAQKILLRLGGRLRVTICGGAPLAPAVARMFIGLGLRLLQGYGLTETSPVISSNKIDDNEPASVGVAFRDVEVRINAEGELEVKSPGICLGYWQKPEATAQLIGADGWLRTGDKARIEDGHIFITGRVKEIIVLANGEKLPPADMEAAILMDPLFEQALVLGEGKPYLSALVVLNKDHWSAVLRQHGLTNASEEQQEQTLLQRIAQQLHAFPGYAQIRRVAICANPWTIENGLITPSLKYRRTQILQHHQAQIAQLYAGH